MGGRRLPREKAGAEADLGDEYRVRLINEYLHRSGHIGPNGKQLAARGEDLDAAVFAVGDIHSLSLIHGDAVRQIELTGLFARFTPGVKQSAVRRKLVDAGVAVTIGHVNFA